MLYFLYDKRTNKKVAIYGVQKNGSGYADFLIRKDNEWRWVSAKHYITLQEHQELDDLEKSSQLTKTPQCKTQCGVKMDYSCCKYCNEDCDEVYLCDNYKKDKCENMI